LIEASFTSTAIEPKRFGGLEVDGKFEFNWLLDWQSAGWRLSGCDPDIVTESRLDPLSLINDIAAARFLVLPV
jgi:hypothetical protein